MAEHLSLIVSAPINEDEEIVSYHSDIDSSQVHTTPTEEDFGSSCCCFHSSPKKIPIQSKYSIPTPPNMASGRAANSNLVHEPWYHGDCTWELAKKRLLKQKSDCFLVRKSQSQPGKYVISVKYGGALKNHTICEKDQHYEVEGTEKQHSSLKHLVAYFSNHYLSTEQEILTTPCPRPTLTPCKEQPSQITSK